MENSVQFINDSWRYVKRTVNINNFTISYTSEGGFKSQQEAEEAKRRDDEQYELTLKRIKKIANIQYTFREYIEYWLKEIFIKNTDTCTKTIGTWAVWNLIIPNVQQDILLNYVTADYINDIIKRCIPVCESAGETTRKFMRKILKDAYAYGLIPKDIRDEIMDVKRGVPHIELLKKEELQKLLQVASTHPGYYFEILLGLFAGLRSGEVRGLRYEDFDAEKQTIRVSRQYTANYFLADSDDHFEYSCFMEEKRPKGDSYRLLHVPSFLFDELERKKEFNETVIRNRKAKGQKKVDEEYVSISAFGQRKAKGTLLCSLKRACNYACIPPISFHTLRHQFATMLIEKGVPFEDVSKLLGHKSVMTTFNIYCGVMDADDDARKAVGVMIPCPEED